MKRRDFIRCGLVGAAMLSAQAPSWAALFPPDPFFGLSFPDLEGREVGLKQYLGRPLVVNFWATWCKPCIEEMPDLQALHETYPDMPFLGIGIDRAKNMLEFLQRVPVGYEILEAGNTGVGVMRALGNRQGGLPFTVVFDARGRIQERMLGQIVPAKLDDVIQRLLST